MAEQLIKHRLVFILPYLNVNTTSSERFKSFIIAAESREDTEVEVITFDYGVSHSFFKGLSFDNVDRFEPKKHKVLKPKLNSLQKLAFSALNKGSKLWRVLQLCHLLIYGRDVFYPGSLFNYFEKGNQPTTIICSGSHFSFFDCAYQLAITYGFTLVLDYRDPWTFGYTAIDGFAFVQKLKVWYGRKKELKFLQKAQLVSTVSQSLKDFFPKHLRQKVEIVPNGSNFKEGDIRPNPLPKTFNIVFAGTLYQEQLSEPVFFEALQRFLKDKERQQIKVQFVGAGNSPALKVISEKYGLSDVVQTTPRLLMKDFLTYMNQASVFLHLRFPSKKGVIGSKYLEYLNFHKAILLPQSDEGDIAQAIGRDKAGFVCSGADDTLVALNKLWERFITKDSLTWENEVSAESAITRDEIARSFIAKVMAV
ncbi:glycosyltransferase [Pelobium manganitolerans]|uniref:glycosyltransferase n=1 Tax=Pelobium manganitolerans TaxID=1842495 RepID=UPI003FA3DA2B